MRINKQITFNKLSQYFFYCYYYYYSTTIILPSEHSIINYLPPSQLQSPKITAHIPSSTNTPQTSNSTTLNSSSSSNRAALLCPITSLPYNGHNKFVAIWKCGHYYSKKAIMETKVDEQTGVNMLNVTNSSNSNKTHNPAEKHTQYHPYCLICSHHIKEDDIIDLNLTPQQLESKRKYFEITLLREKEKKQKDRERQKNNRGSKDHSNDQLGKSNKRVKAQQPIHKSVFVSPLDQLGDQFRDVLRHRSQFKQLFEHKKI